jgi:hypothetical protein
MMTDMERNLPFQLGDRLVCILAFSQSFNPLILCGFHFPCKSKEKTDRFNSFTSLSPSICALVQPAVW